MDNKHTNTDCQKVVRVGGQKWETVEITVRISFFCLRFVFTTSYTGSFQVPPEKITPTQSVNSHQKFQFDLSPSYINLLRNGSTTPPTPPYPREVGDGGVNYVFDNSMSFLHSLHLALFSSFAVVNRDLNWSSSSQLALNNVFFFHFNLFNQNDTKLI